MSIKWPVNNVGHFDQSPRSSPDSNEYLDVATWNEKKKKVHFCWHIVQSLWLNYLFSSLVIFYPVTHVVDQTRAKSSNHQINFVPVTVGGWCAASQIKVRNFWGLQTYQLTAVRLQNANTKRNRLTHCHSRQMAAALRWGRRWRRG